MSPFVVALSVMFLNYSYWTYNLSAALREAGRGTYFHCTSSTVYPDRLPRWRSCLPSGRGGCQDDAMVTTSYPRHYEIWDTIWEKVVEFLGSNGIPGSESDASPTTMKLKCVYIALKIYKIHTLIDVILKKITFKRGNFD